MIESKVQEIVALFALLANIETKTIAMKRRKQVVWRKFNIELDFFIDRLEDIYYKYFIKNKSIKKLETDLERDIAATKNTMNMFLPYMLLYNMNVAAAPIDMGV